MKITHIACVNRAAKNLGVASQMFHESVSASELGINWDVQLWAADRAEYDICHSLGPLSGNFLIRRIRFFNQLRKTLKESNIVLLRYMPLDFFSLLLPRRDKKKIVLVYHTARKEYLKNIKIFGKIIYAFDELTQWVLKKQVLGIVGVTSQILKLETEGSQQNSAINTTYPNALNLSHSETKLRDSREGKIKIAFVASQFYYWNGLDRLLHVFCNEYQDDVELILVGRLTTPDQQKLVQQRPELIRHYDQMTASELNNLYSKIDLSLAAFDLHLVGLDEACTLKVRESLMHGVAVYSGHKDTVLSGSTYFFEGGVDREQIISIAKEMRHQRKDTVFQHSRLLIDKKMYVSQLWEKLNEIKK